MQCRTFFFCLSFTFFTIHRGIHINRFALSPEAHGTLKLYRLFLYTFSARQKPQISMIDGRDDLTGDGGGLRDNETRRAALLSFFFVEFGLLCARRRAAHTVGLGAKLFIPTPHYRLPSQMPHSVCICAATYMYMMHVV